MLLVLSIFAFFGLLALGIWGFRVLTAPIKGAGDQEIIINDGRNRINAQEWFESQYGSILSADQNLDQAARNLALDPEDDFYRTNYTGLQNRCHDMVNAYNAEAQKVSRGDWRDPHLPERISDSDPKTDCEPTEGILTQ